MRTINYSTKRWVPWFFVLTFVVMAPLLAFYAVGWRFDLRVRQVVRTGTIVVNSTPSDAIITLQGTPLPNRSPSSIRNMLPGTYHLTVSKKGYTSWEHQIAVAQGAAAYVTARLYPDPVLPVTVAQNIAHAAFVSKTYSFIAHDTNGNWRLETRSAPDANPETKAIIGLPESLGSLSVTPHARLDVYLIEEKRREKRWTLTPQGPFLLATALRSDLTDYIWHPDEPALIGRDRKGAIVKIGLQQQKKTVVLLPEPTAEFAVATGLLRPSVYYLTQERPGQNPRLGRTELDVVTEPTELISLPEYIEGNIVPGPRNHLALIDKTDSRVHIIDLERKQIIGEAPGTNVRWHPKYSDAIIWNNDVIFVIRIASDGTMQSTFVGRWKEPIRDVSWIEDDTDHFIIAFDRRVAAIEIDAPPGAQREQTLLKTSNPIRALINVTRAEVTLLVGTDVVVRPLL